MSKNRTFLFILSHKQASLPDWWSSLISELESNYGHLMRHQLFTI